MRGTDRGRSSRLTPTSYAQSAEITEKARRCDLCGGRLQIKDWARRRIHTLFGRVHVQAPRLVSCRCTGEQARAFSPLKGWLARSSQELRYQAARLGSMYSYRQAATTLHDLLGADLSFGFVGVRKAVLQAGSRLDQEPTIAHEPDLPPRSDNPSPALTFAFDRGYARRTRKGPRRNFEIPTGACEKNGKIRVFATAFQGSKSLRERLYRFVGRVRYDQENPTALITDGAGSLLRLYDLECYLRKNEASLISYRDWRQAGRRISTSAVEGTVNRLIGRRMCKSQHMCWTKRGAHLLLQVRCAIFNGDLLAGFRRWFPTVGTRRIMMPWDWLPQQ